jgi:hypothetical protein
LITGCGPESGPPRDLAIGDLLEDDLSIEDARTSDDGAGDLAPGDGGNAYDDLGDTDSGCAPPNVGSICQMPILPTAGCGAVEDCGPSGTGNGLDDNCDGRVDETCTCTPGEVRSCFLGPPGKRNVGACRDGKQTCMGAEIGSWGPCSGSIAPGGEGCNGLDDDCNGCADDGLCCASTLACPSSVPDAQPFTDVSWNGAAWFKGTAAAWSWTVSGGPCDQLFVTTTTPVTQSFTLANGATAAPTLHPTLSGDYTVTMRADGTDGKSYTCRFVQHVVGPGVRIELCWDHTGTAAQGGADLDLHVHRSGTTTNWFYQGKIGAGLSNPDDCYYANCTASEYAPLSVEAKPDWGYASSPLSMCLGSPNGGDWMANLGACHDPRLDLDNVSSVGVPENTNIDAPNDGDTFRAMVHYFGQEGMPMPKKQTLVTHPIVNIYCAGQLKATYGEAPDLVPGFDHGSGVAAGLMWRVADVTAIVNALGATTDCTVKMLHPPATPNKGYYVTDGVLTY